MKHNIFDLNLPGDARNKQLEIISKDYFRPLFDVERFVVKEEAIDNGIDFRFEIKLNNCITGFGFNFQLKSTESTRQNNDGSYSKNIETSNIEYLLNNGQPGYYAFYIDDEKLIYYAELKKIIYDLTVKNPNWQNQPNHSIRFTEKLDADAITTIYNTALTEGQMLRRIQGAMAEGFGQIEKKDRIIIDLDSNVVTDFEIAENIEKYGLFLIDECRWADVIALHKKTTNTHARSAMYNLVIGVSYYYSGEFFRAMDFLKETYKNIDNLEHYLKDYMLFFYYGLQRILNIITEDDFQRLTHAFAENSTIFIHRELEDAVQLKVRMHDSPDSSSLEFEKKIAEIINNPYSSDYIKLLAKIELTFYRSEQLISKLIMMLLSGNLADAKRNFTTINREFRDLLEECEKINSNFASHFCGIKHCTFIIHFDCIFRRLLKSNSFDDVLADILINLQKIYTYFKTINHVENELCSLSLLLEYYQNLENKDKIREIENTLDQYKIEYGNHEFNKKIDFTKNGGTFVSFIVGESSKIEQETELVDQLMKEMEVIEQTEAAEGYVYDASKHMITLFPLGNFQFPEDKTDVLFQILGINDQRLKEQIKNMLEYVTPVINCLPLKIEQEGPLNGMLEDRGLQSRKNINRIRKELYHNKFQRI
ncbi:DUF4365 domain-containing protein [uncultured Sphingobacterium sp.]|uniref:DUF4365 domain-containing protein n=1 Tax=uncultured Sphingobacterium sp. TaxID=182688 RepID=UPI003748B97D